MSCAEIWLIRHAAHAQLGRVLSGRIPDVELSPEGREQAAGLARTLASANMSPAIESSPVARAEQTARALATACGVSVATVDALDEVDFGEWTGRDFASLTIDPRWSEWNEHRALACCPGGETMGQVQDRAWAHIRSASERAGEGTRVMVTHCDVIRAVVARVLGLSLDAILRFAIDPASITRLRVASWGAEVLSLNERPWSHAA